MHELRFIRENPEEFDRGLIRRGLPPQAEAILALDRSWREAETKAQEAQAERNRLSREIGAFKARGIPADSLIQLQPVRKLAEQQAAAEATRLRAEIDTILAGLPNLPAPDVPDGLDESANRVLRHEGEPPRFDFAPLSHDALGEALGLMDFKTASKLSGSRFVVLKGALARLERALMQFML
ncbi:MAG: serine--tRNA ligase, partial [Stellaceae bacterium]